MPTNAIGGFGTLVKIGDGGGTEVFTTIAELKNIKLPGVKNVVVDVTSHSSPGGIKEKLAVLGEITEMTFDVSFIPTGATHSYTSGLLKDALNRTKRNFKVVLPDAGATTWQGAAYVEEFTPEAPVDNVLKASIKLTPAGQWTFAG